MAGETISTYKGLNAAVEAPGHGTVENGAIVTLLWNGPKDKVSSAVPKVGADYTYDGKTYVVQSSKVTPTKGDLATGEAVIIRKSIVLGTGGVTNVSGHRPTWEVDFAQLEKSLLAHPDFSGYADEVDKWRNSPAKVRNANKYVDGDQEIEIVNQTTLKILEKIRKGVESYLVFTPVITKTSYYGEMPNNLGGNIGKIETPSPPEAIAGNWEYLKTADRTSLGSDGLWVRVETWTGAEEWDRDLYGDAAGGQ